MTGLNEVQFERLVRELTWFVQVPRNTGGRPYRLSLVEQVEMTLVLLRHNVTEELVAGFYGVSQATVSRVRTRVRVALARWATKRSCALRTLARGRVVLVDGTYVPTGNRPGQGRDLERANYSGKRHCQNLNIQVAATLDGRLLATSAPSPGATHDSRAFTESGWGTTLKKGQWIADRAYIATGAITPYRKPQHRELTQAEKSSNSTLASLRAPVERCISHLKNWRIISRGYRGQLKHLPTLMAIITALETYRTYE
jgi:hypothetical protein